MLFRTARARQSAEPGQRRERRAEESEIAILSKSCAHPNFPARSVPAADRIAAVAPPGSLSSDPGRVCIPSASRMRQLGSEARMLCSA